MRKSRLLSTFVGLSSVVACATPVVFTTSCNKLKKWASYNFVELFYAGEYEPVVKPLENSTELSSEDEVIELYLNKIKENPQIFKDDFCYTANLVRDDSEVNEIYGAGRAGIFKIQANVGKVEVDVAQHTINFTLGFYIAGSILGTTQQKLSGENCYKDINVYLEVTRDKPFKVTKIKRDPVNYKTKENILILTSTETKKDGDLLLAPYTLTMDGTFWYYNTIGELVKYTNVNLKQHKMNTNEDFSKEDQAYSELSNTYSCWITRYLSKNGQDLNRNQMPIASKYLTNFRQPN